MPWAVQAANVTGGEAPRAVVDWTRSHARPFSGTAPDGGFNDLTPLRTIVGDARIVALGETTHGSHEVAQMKHRLVAYFATQLGFTLLAAEANMTDARRMNDFVEGGAGDPVEFLRGLRFWMFSTTEVRDMVNWMRQFNLDETNRRAGRHLGFAGFDMQSPDVAATAVRDYLARREPDYLPKLELAVAAFRVQQKFSAISGRLPIELVRGHRVVLAGWIKTTEMTEGRAGFWFAADANGSPAAYNNSQRSGPRGTTGWQRHEIAVDVPANATGASFGLMTGARGQAWFDDIEVTIDGAPYAAPTLDLGFEAGDFGGLENHSSVDFAVESVEGEAHCGRRSLRVTGRAVPSPSPQELRRTWQQCEEHLAALRPADGPDEEALAWARQNAHLVNQSFAVQDGPPSARDQMMAENVEWLVRQHPGAKILLWAHNGHVGRRFDQMGGYLAVRHPTDMAVIGFATGSGSYLAVPRNRMGLEAFPLDPPPVDSVEAILAETGIPRFILDLRPTRSVSNVASWFAVAREHRLIGGGEAENEFMEREVGRDYDALIWIDKTTASVPITTSNR